jgi:hypothetical protein
MDEDWTVNPGTGFETAGTPDGAWGSRVAVEDLDQLSSCLARLPGADAVRSHFHIPLTTVTAAEPGWSTTVVDSAAGLAAALDAGDADFFACSTKGRTQRGLAGV